MKLYLILYDLLNSVTSLDSEWLPNRVSRSQQYFSKANIYSNSSEFYIVQLQVIYSLKTPV